MLFKLDNDTTTFGRAQRFYFKKQNNFSSDFIFKQIVNTCVKSYHFAYYKFSTNDRSGKGNIVATENEQDKVWGVIFDINDIEIPQLDIAEGGYHRIQITCYDAAGQTYPSQTYIANENRINNNIQAFDWYKQFVIRG